MKLSVKAMAAACSLLWAGAILMAGICHMIWPSYAGAFLDMIASIYPGYAAGGGAGSAAVGTLYGLADGAIAGALLAWLYNMMAR